jgi:hypothetical protein
MSKDRNGSNGHNSGTDFGLREETTAPCAARLDHGGWCVRPDKHLGACSGLPRAHGPVDNIWHRHRGQMIICGKVIGPGAVCLKQRGHGDKCTNE